MYDTIILEADNSNCIKILETTNGIKSEKLLVERGKQAVIFIDFITTKVIGNSEINKLNMSDYKVFYSGFSDGISIKANNRTIKKIDIYNGYKIFLKKIRPDFEDKQIEGFAKDKLDFIKNDYARIFSYIIFIEDKNHSLDNKDIQKLVFDKNTIYTALSEKGFILGDIPSIKENSKNQNDLLKAFTTTELANDLLEAGLMILSWGMTPYQYFIGFSQNMPRFITDSKYKRDFYGKYKIKEDTNILSLIKGDLISDLKSINEKNKHKIKIKNKANADGYHYISLSLYIVNTNSFNQPISPVCFFVLNNLEYKIDYIEPALNYDIFS